MLLRAAKLLEDMRRSGQFILEDVDGLTYELYLRNRLVRQASERNFEIMGEAMRRLTRVDRDLAESITGYRNVIGLRNVIIHSYDRVDPAALWEIIETTLPPLIEEVKALVEEADREWGDADGQPTT